METTEDSNAVQREPIEAGTVEPATRELEHTGVETAGAADTSYEVPHAQKQGGMPLGKIAVVLVVLVVAVGIWAGCTAISPVVDDTATDGESAAVTDAAGMDTAGTDEAVADSEASADVATDANAEADDAQAVESTGSEASEDGGDLLAGFEVATTGETYKGIPVGFTENGLPYRGEPDAPVTMIEFSDYQCPFCNRYFVQTEPAIDESYVRSGDVRVVFSDFPLEGLHPNAPAAHEAGLCVADQGSAELYWMMHAELFRSVDEWQAMADPMPIFARLAEEVGADMDAYNACLESAAQQQLVAQRTVEAANRGFSGTPSFQIVRGMDNAAFELVGAQPFDQFASLLDAVLAGETPVTAEESQAQGQGEEGGIPYWASAEGLTPDPERPGYNMAGDIYRGNLDAPVVVVEFSDFQCPYCKRHVEQTQPALDEQFVDSGQVLWVFKHFPLNIHPQAPAAGVAAECAADQGQFWEMHHLLFESVGDWSVLQPNEVLVGLGEELGLDTEAFAACLESEAAQLEVESDLQEGSAYVRGTPTFIILYNGEGSIIPGALPAERFTQVLQEILDEVEAS